MKQYQRSFAVLAMLAIGLTGTARAQQAGVSPIWMNYLDSLHTLTAPYAPMSGATVTHFPPARDANTLVQFVDFNGAIDPDNGTANNIPVGFTFAFNNNLSNSVDINVNGWISVIDMYTGQIGPYQVLQPANQSDLFAGSSLLPHNTIAPYWGDHFYVSSAGAGYNGVLGYTPSEISYTTSSVPDLNKNSTNYPFDKLYTFEVEWKNLNINDKTNPNSVGSFQLFIRQNPMANDKSVPDQRATIEFQYGPVGTGVPNSTVTVTGAAVGMNDSAGFTHFNALFQSPDTTDIANNTTTRTTCWPPAGCAPGYSIRLVPQGRTLLNTWGDGDVLLEQLNSPSTQVRNNQSLFVTVADAMAILQASANGVPLNPEEGGPAFHGDANHTSGPGAALPGITYGVTLSTTTSVFTATATTGFVAGQSVSFTSTGTLPSPLTLGTNYYVIGGVNLGALTFQISTTLGGPALTGFSFPAGAPTTFFASTPSTNPDYNTTYGTYSYFTTPYDASYILMYLAGKLSTLPWPEPLPVPGYKSTEIHSTDVSGVVADVSNISTTGSTVFVPITIRGSVNGPLSIQMDLKGLGTSGLQFVGTRAPDGTLICSNASLGRIALATSGEFSDGQTVGYIELRAPANTNTGFDLENVQVNDMNVPPSHVALKLGGEVAGVNGVSDLEQNVPNPFVVSASGQTTIGFDLAAPENVTLRVFDVLGHEVRTLIAGSGRAAGPNTIQWDGRDNGGNVVADGMYFYQMVTPDFTGSAKMQVVH